MKPRTFKLCLPALALLFSAGCNFGGGSSAASSPLEDPTKSQPAVPTSTPSSSPLPSPTAAPSPTPDGTVIIDDPNSPGISGTVSYESVPVTATAGLDYAHTVDLPVRGVLVEAVESPSNTVVTSTSTDDSGKYSLAIPTGRRVFVRVKARIYRAGTPSWDFQVVDNTRSKGLYAMDGSVVTIGSTRITKNLKALSGWGSEEYVTDRAAAPFAILDVVKKSMDTVLSANASARFPLLLINWSVKNIPTSGTKANGEIGTSHFDTVEKQLYILGADGSDTDEYDTHVIAHEWGHYFEHTFGRSDTTGGSHTVTSRLDPRLAFSEAFGNSFSAMAMGASVYSDSSDVLQGSTQITFDLDASPAAGTRRGWFNESSVQSILYDIFDSPSSDDDGLQGGFKPIYETLNMNMRNSIAFTTIYSFATGFRSRVPASAAALNQLLRAQSISDATVDETDSTATETNNGGTAFSLPIYSQLKRGITSQLCTTGNNGGFNKIGVRRFFQFEMSASATAKLTVTPVKSSGDPGIVIYNKGVKVGSADLKNTGVAEVVSVSLAAGTFVGEVYDYRQMAQNLRSEECFNVKFE